MGDSALRRRPPGEDAAGTGRRRLSFARLSGLDRSGPAPAETQRGAPLRPWTVPNAIGFTRLGLIPVFLAVAFSSRDGRSAAAAIVFAVIAWSDYADGIAARLTGQYSRLGALMDPLIDRLLVIAGLLVCWNFALLPRAGIVLLLAREAFMLLVTQAAVRRGIELSINWLGRAGVWPAMSAPFFAMAGAHDLATACLWVGLAVVYAASVMYARDALEQLRTRAGPGP